MESRDIGIERQIIESSSSNMEFIRYGPNDRTTVEEPIIRELPITLFVNGREIVRLMCTPTKETYLIAGFLYMEGIITALEDVLYMRVCAEENVADVRLNKELRIDRPVRTITSGCGGGTTFLADLNCAPVKSDVRITAGQITKTMVTMLQRAGIYRETGGVHTSALSDGEALLVVAEDVGRHNTIDKIAGECLLLGIPTGGRFLLTTGRLSSEMLIKASRLDIPMVLSRSSPTDLAVQLARDLNITLVGYVRGHSFNVYSHDWRIS